MAHLCQAIGWRQTGDYPLVLNMNPFEFADLVSRLVARRAVITVAKALLGLQVTVRSFAAANSPLVGQA